MALSGEVAQVRVFIGSSRKNRVEEKVFIQSLRSHAKTGLEINILDGDSSEIRWQSGAREPLPGVAGHAGAVTKFSLARFAIPQLCSFQGRAIYCDSDQLVFADLSEIAALELGDAVAAAVRVADAICAEPYRRAVLQPLMASGEDYFLTSVMLVDCARARNWDIARFQQQIADRSLDYTGLMFFGRREREMLGWKIAALPPVWNSLDHRDERTRLLHFTDLKSQPWLFPHNPTSPVWERALWSAFDQGAVQIADLRIAREHGGIDPRTRWTTALPAAMRARAHAVWSALDRWLRPSAWMRMLDRGLSAALPDTYWHWRRVQKPDRKLGWYLQLCLERLRPLRRRYLFVIYSAACERVLVPVARALAADRDLDVVAVLAGPKAQQRRLAPDLKRAGCRIDRQGITLMRAQQQPQQAVVVQCLDHRQHYRHHRIGVDVADALGREGVPTVCLQHGGTRGDSLSSLASSAARHLLVWGRYAERELIETHGLEPARVQVTGNPLHDPLSHSDRAGAQTALAAFAPAFAAGLQGRQLILLASTMQREYSDRPDEADCYRRYLRHLYASIDFASQTLVVKMHPCDLDAGVNFYEEMRPPGRASGDLLVIPAGQGPDVYTLLRLSDLLLTRCSTVAEEALLLGRPVVAFDLDEQGPSRAYSHLAGWGRYRIAYAQPPESLAAAIGDSLALAPEEPGGVSEAVAELSLALDGRSLQRTLDALRQIR